jgi:hypothetical protein
MLTIPLTGCLVETFSGISAGAEVYRAYKESKEKDVVVTAPPVVEYSESLQTKAAAELKALPPPCSRYQLRDPCSALSRLVMDYQLMRDQARALDAP